MTTDRSSSSQGRRVRTSGDVEVGTYLEIAKEKGGYQPATENKPSAVKEAVIVFDFGSQYSLLIARRVRELHVFCEIVPFDAPKEQVMALNPKGFIFSGGPASVYEKDAPHASAWVFNQKLPVLGICYGMQEMAHQLGGKVAPGIQREYGHAVVHQNDASHPLFEGLPAEMPVWMSHGDRIHDMPQGFKSLAYSENSPVAAMGNAQNVIGLQFHPEVAHTPYGKVLLKNFLFNICKCTGDWTPGNFVADTIEKIRKQVGSGKVICALSGGVDSSVTAVLIHRAIGDQLTCIFVDNGLLRHKEAEQVVETFKHNLKLNLQHVDATDRFMNRLKGVTDPEDKRKRIGEEFIHLFEEEANKLGKVDFLAQGTLYPDVIESQPAGNKVSVKIKTHHNVGGLPKNMTLQLIEPLRLLFKDEVREAGRELGISDELLMRQPFPGPGLAIRCIGEVTKERLDTLRAADWIAMEEIRAANLYEKLWQSFVVLAPVKTVGVMGDLRTYAEVAALRAVTSEDAMTADWARLPYDVLARISSRIVNEVPGVNRVVYDITSKPPGTIEWE